MSKIEIEGVIPIYKHEGETPLQCLERFRACFSDYANIPMTYAGRLDPMASGLLIVLAGEACKEKEKYLRLDKEYIVEVALGVATDTGDILGLPVYGNLKFALPLDSAKEVPKLKGLHDQPYPAFSSKPVQGKPLFMWAKEAHLDEIVVPIKTIEIYEAKFLGASEIPTSEFAVEVVQRIQRVSGDFRQEEIKAGWGTVWDGNSGSEKIPTIKMRIRSSSGTYMRYLAEELGKRLGTRACARSIKRIGIGSFHLPE